MKKFLIVATSVLLLVFFGYYLSFYHGIYFSWNRGKEVKAEFITENKKIYIKKGDKEEELIIKGVELESSMPYAYTTDFKPTKEDYLRWLQGIGELGANTVKVPTIMDDDFYNALYEYNAENESPLYLLQGLWVSDYASNSSEDAYGDDFYKQLRKDVRDIVDVIHGHKNIMTNKIKGYGIYRKDVSDWVIGYAIGSQWDVKTIAYTNHNERERNSFQGDYFKTTDEANPFEVMLADLMERLVAYETSKYGEQRLVTFYSDPSMDPFEYEEEYASQLNKYVSLNMEHILSTNKLYSGYFASYALYDFCPKFYRYLSKEQKKELQPLLKEVNKKQMYDGYVELLAKYHTMPVVILSFGYSSARGSDSNYGTTKEEQYHLTEKEQGERLVKTYETIKNAGCSGGIIKGYKDIFSQRTWNTMYAVDILRTRMWKDIQSANTGYGLITFESGEEEKVCYIDGNKEEWEESELILQQNGMKVYQKQDMEALYFLVEKEGLTKENPFYMGFDLTEKSGATYARRQKLAFDRPVDFLLEINGRNESRLLVQERYDAVRENYLMEIQDEDPFIVVPKKDGQNFVAIRMILKNIGVEKQKFDEQGNPLRRLMKTFETGKLTYGNGNPNADDYNSLSDFCYGDDFVEIRIPWQLLNVSDPTNMEIHDDYYENYGVESRKMDHFYLGIIEKEQKENGMHLEEVEIKPVKKEAYHERFKESYFIVKEYWSH